MLLLFSLLSSSIAAREVRYPLQALLPSEPCHECDRPVFGSDAPSDDPQLLAPWLLLAVLMPNSHYLEAVVVVVSEAAVGAVPEVAPVAVAAVAGVRGPGRLDEPDPLHHRHPLRNSSLPPRNRMTPPRTTLIPRLTQNI